MAIMIAKVQPAGSKAAASSGKASGKTMDFGAMITANLSKQDLSSKPSQPEGKPAEPSKAEGANNQEALKTLNGKEKLENPAKDAGTVMESAKSPEEIVKEMAEKLGKNVFRTVIQGVFQDMKEAVQDILDLDEEELNLLMEQLGITAADLWNPSVLQELVVASKGEGDISSLLTDESLYGTVKQLQDTVAGILQDANVTEQDIAAWQSKKTLAKDFVRVMEKTAAEQPVQETAADAKAKAADAEAKAWDAEDAAPVQETEKSSFQFEAVRETSDAGQEESGQDKNSAEGFSKQEQFLNLVANALPEANDEAEIMFSRLTPAQQIREIADQILEKVRIVLNPAQTSMEITLNPESLGRVSLNLISKQGLMTAHFAVQNQLARTAIESQMPILRENLENQGIKVEAIEVTVSNFEFSQSGGAQSQGQQGGRPQHRRNITIEEAGFFEEVTEEEAIAIDMLERSGNSVDYTA